MKVLEAKAAVDRQTEKGEADERKATISHTLEEVLHVDGDPVVFFCHGRATLVAPSESEVVIFDLIQGVRDNGALQRSGDQCCHVFTRTDKTRRM